MRESWLISIVVLSTLAGCPSNDVGDDEVGATETQTSDATDTGSSTGTTDASTTDASTTDASTTDASTTDASTTDTSTTDTSTTDTTTGVEPGCGDGNLDPGEACDDGNADAGDGCSSTCMLESRIAFTTSTLHTGNLGGLTGADSICNMRAAEAGLPGTYMAWISTDQGSPSTRFVQSTVAYVKVDGVKIADDWTDLVDGTLDAAINQTETGATPQSSTYICNGTARQTWTGTALDGTPSANNCTNFSSTGSTGAIGRNTGGDANWSVCNPSVACTNMAPLYCFQQ